MYALSSDSNVLAINETSGAIYVDNTLDYENATFHIVYVTASDMGSPVLSSTPPLRLDFTVQDVNDNHPVFENDEPQNIRCVENHYRLRCCCALWSHKERISHILTVQKSTVCKMRLICRVWISIETALSLYV